MVLKKNQNKTNTNPTKQHNNKICKQEIIFCLLAIFWFRLGDNKPLEQLAQSSQESVLVLKKPWATWSECAVGPAQAGQLD